MMQVLYFAWLRAKTGIGSEDVAPPAEVATVGQLIDWLKQRGPGHAEAFADLSVVRCAVNQDHSGLDAPLKAGDEIAFFPPVTGG
jgi:molybdopterin converting factor subunit 1